MASWQSQIDNEHIVLSTLARTYGNGSPELRAHLAPIHDHDGAVVGWLDPFAARSWDAMVAHAWRDGIDLRPTSSGDTFRRIEDQDRIRDQRYHPCAGGQKCRGKVECLNPGQAAAACPGTSRHGKAGAVDFRRPTRTTLQWMEIHAHEYGWAWELPSEEWHVHYMLGDAVTPAVLEHEKNAPQHHPEELTVADIEEIVKRLDRIDRKQMHLPQNGMVDWGAQGGDLNGFGVTAVGECLQVIYAGKMIKRVLVPKGQAVAIFAGPYVDLDAGEGQHLQIELVNGKIRWLTFDGHRNGFPGPVLDESGKPDPHYHLVEDGGGWHYFDV